MSRYCPNKADSCPRTSSCPTPHIEKWLKYAAFCMPTPLAWAMHYLIRKPRSPPRRTAMKFETLMLNSLFVACLVICVTTLGAMLA